MQKYEWICAWINDCCLERNERNHLRRRRKKIFRGTKMNLSLLLSGVANSVLWLAPFCCRFRIGVCVCERHVCWREKAFNGIRQNATARRRFLITYAPAEALLKLWTRLWKLFRWHKCLRFSRCHPTCRTHTSRLKRWRYKFVKRMAFCIKLLGWIRFHGSLPVSIAFSSI